MNRSFTAGKKTPVCHCVWGLAVWGGGVSPESIGIHRRRRHGQVKLKGGVPGRLACWGTADRQAACGGTDAHHVSGQGRRSGERAWQRRDEARARAG